MGERKSPALKDEAGCLTLAYLTTVQAGRLVWGMKIFQIVELATEESVGPELTPTSVFPSSAGREGSSGSQIMLLPPASLCPCNIPWLLEWVLCLWLYMNH